MGGPIDWVVGSVVGASGCVPTLWIEDDTAGILGEVSAHAHCLASGGALTRPRTAVSPTGKLQILAADAHQAALDSSRRLDTQRPETHTSAFSRIANQLSSGCRLPGSMKRQHQLQDGPAQPFTAAHESNSDAVVLCYRMRGAGTAGQDHAYACRTHHGVHGHICRGAHTPGSALSKQLIAWMLLCHTGISPRHPCCL